MQETSKRSEEIEESYSELDAIFNDKKKTHLIHYSCESFIPDHGNNPRITSISIKNLGSGSVTSFSIHLQAQLSNQDVNSSTKLQFDDFEKKMLDEFYSFLKRNQNGNWVHWNMRNANFGFQAIANRYKILGGIPIYLAEEKQHDLPRILGKIYTYRYEEHGNVGRLINLANRNGVSTAGALPGEEEAKAWNNKQYLKVHQSTLKKIDILESIIELAHKKELIVNTDNRFNIIIRTSELIGEKNQVAIAIAQNQLESLVGAYYARKKSTLVNGIKFKLSNIQVFKIFKVKEIYSDMHSDDYRGMIKRNSRLLHNKKTTPDLLREFSEEVTHLYINNKEPRFTQDNWNIIHPIIQQFARDKFEDGHYADAVLSAFKELNDVIKSEFKKIKSIEEDGDSLMKKAFSLNNPIFVLGDLSTDTGKSIQLGYMELFAGSMKGIRNPNAHANLNIDEIDAWEKLVIASHLMKVFDTRL